MMIQMRGLVLTIGLSLASFGFASSGVLSDWARVNLLGQTVVSGDTVQAAVDAAIDSGASTYLLPAATIQLSQSLRIKPGTRNFTLQGQNGTRLVRNSASDFSLLEIGQGHPYAFNNAAFASLPKTDIANVAEGSTTISRTGGATVEPGYYAIIGTDPTADIVRLGANGTTYWFKRELIRVVSVNGDQVTIATPLGRDFGPAELRKLEATNTPAEDRVVCENITIRDVVLDGFSSVDRGRTQKIFRATLVRNLTVNDVSFFGFHNAAMSAMFSNGVYVNNCRFSDGTTTTLGYGIEVAGSRFITIRNSSFRTHRWGIVFTSGCMDALVEDCIYAAGTTGGFDASHGGDERRITYRRCAAPTFSIGNPGFLRGAKDILLENCTAYESINLFGNTRNVVVDGKHPNHPITTPLIQFFSERNTTSIPADLTKVESATFRNGITERNVVDGTNIYLVSVSGAPRGAGNVRFENWSFKTGKLDGGSAVDLSRAGYPTTFIFTGCTFQNSHRYTAPLAISHVTDNGIFNVSVYDSKFLTPSGTGIFFTNTTRATFAEESNLFNSQPLSSDRIVGLGQATGGMTPP